MHALVAAAGTARIRFERFGASAVRLYSSRLNELTASDAEVRLGAVYKGGPVVATARGAGRVMAVFGSGVPCLSPRVLDRWLSDVRAGGAGFLDDAPRDLAVIAADPLEGTLFMGTSQGHARLFVAEVAGGLLLSTQMRLLTDALGPDLEVDRTYEDFFLGFGFLPDGKTVYRGVRVLPQGVVQTWPRSRVGTVSSPWSANSEPPDNPSEIRRALYEGFFQALEEQVGTARQHAVLLGGLDSALVLAGLRRLGHKVEAYTFSFGDGRYEQQNAERMASHFGARHHWVAISPETIGTGLERFSELFNQPTAQPHYLLHTWHASRVIASHGHNHIFTGDGCDAHFLGYPTVSRRARVIERIGMIPSPVRRHLLRLASKPIVERRGGHVVRTIRSVLRSQDLPWPARGHLPTQYLDEAALGQLRVSGWTVQEESVRHVRLRLSKGLENLDPVRLAFHGNALTGQSSTKVEGAVSTSGIPQFSPYLHPLLSRVASALPLELLRPSGAIAGSPGKAVLLDMVREYQLLPEFIIQMPKQSPTESPIDQWYAGPLRPLVHRLMEELPFEYERRYIDQILSPKWAEALFRARIGLSPHAFQAIGLLSSYAAFTGRGR